MKEPLENLSNRKILKFRVKEVLRSILLKSVVIAIWELRDRDSPLRSQWRQMSLVCYVPEEFTF